MSLLQASVRCLRPAHLSIRSMASSCVAREANTPSKVGAASETRDKIKEQHERETTPVAADLISDVPTELRQRTVRIFKPAKTANSSGKAGTSFWRVDFDILQGSARWENPLIGWASSGDYMQGTYLKFRTKDDAIHFCEKQNWPYFIQEPHVARIGPKSYAANYAHIPGKLRIHHTNLSMSGNSADRTSSSRMPSTEVILNSRGRVRAYARVD